MLTFSYRFNGEKFFIVMVDTEPERLFTGAFLDYEIASLISLTNNEYEQIMLTRYNGGREKTRIYFNMEEDAINACNFLNVSYKLMSR